MTRSLARSLLLAALLPIAPVPAGTYSDVPTTHWAYQAVHRVAAAAGIEPAGVFEGGKPVSRFQLAEVVARILAAVGPGGAAALTDRDQDDLGKVAVELQAELAGLGTKVAALETGREGLAAELAALKAGSGTGRAPGARRDPFSGFLSVGLAATDDGGAGLLGPTAGLALTRYSGSPDQAFFNVPQASIALDQRVGKGLGLHLQLDYDTDGINLPLNGVGFNEVYLTVDRLFGAVGAKLGAFALPFQSWEWNGPFRTLTSTINPSAVGDFFESHRPVGIELGPEAGRDPGALRWHLGLFSGADSATPAPLGFMSDFITIAQLQFSPNLDDKPGWYADLESGADPERDWGWRVGWFDLGGNDSLPTNPSADLDGWTLGLWGRFHDLTVTAQWLEVDQTPATAPGVGLDSEAWYLLLAYRIDSRWSVAVRYDDWSNEPTPTGVGTEGDAWTFAVNRRLSETSRLQLEYQAPDEGTTAGPGFADFPDDLVQLRYSVWF